MKGTQSSAMEEEEECLLSSEVPDPLFSSQISNHSTPQPIRVGEHDVNLLKIHIFLVRIGQWVFLNVFQWGYQGGDEYPYTYILEHSPYRKDLKKFLHRWKHDLEKKKPVTEFDIPLLFILIRSTCGLAPFDDNVWKSESGDELEALLFAVKDNRDQLFHRTPNKMTDESHMRKKARELGKLYKQIIEKAGESFNIEPERVQMTIYHVKDAILNVMNANLSLEFKDKIALKKLLQCDGKVELQEAYKGIQKIQLGTHVLCDKMFDIEDVYMETEMALTVANENVDIEEMFQVWKAERKPRDILVITGPPGSGKTTMFKYLVHSWITEYKRIKSLLDYDLVLYIECRSSSMVSLGHFIQTLMPKTAANFKNDDDIRSVLSRLRVLVLVDGVDEMSVSTVGFLTSIFCTEGDAVHIICSTRNEGFSSLHDICRRTERSTVQLSLRGVSATDRRAFIFHILRNFGNETYQTAGWNAVYGFLSARSSRVTNAFCSPLLLTILVLLWVWKAEVGRLTTGTSINEEIEQLICIRLVENLSTHAMTKEVPMRDLQPRVFRILEKIHKIAFEMLLEDKTILPRSYIKALELDCVQFGLPFMEVVSAFLNVRQSFEGARVVNSYSFYHKTDQEFKAAKHSSVTFARTGDFNVTHHHESTSAAMSLQYYIYQIGILTNNYPEMLESHVENIIHVACERKHITEMEWLEFLVEGDCRDTLCRALGRTMKCQENHNWSILDSMVNGLPILLQYAAPKKLNISLGTNPEGFPILKGLLANVAAYPVELWLTFLDHYVSYTPVRSDLYLAEVLNHPNRRCTLTEFLGSLSPSMIPRLPETMIWVCLRVNFQELLAFAGKLPAFSKLRRFELLLDDDRHHAASMFPTLKSSAGVLVALPNLCDKYVPWACDVLQVLLSKAFIRIKLFACKLSLKGIEAFIKGLHKNQVRIERIGTLQVRHENVVTSEDKARLNSIAKTCGYELEWRKGD